MPFATTRYRVIWSVHVGTYLTVLLGFCLLMVFPRSGLMANEAIALAPQHIQAGAAGHLTINLELPDGYHLNPRAPLTYTARVSGTGLSLAESAQHFHATAPPLPLSMAFQAAPGEHQATIDIAMTFYYCREDDTGVCALQSVRWLVPLHTTTSGVTVQPGISYKAEAPVINKQL